MAYRIDYGPVEPTGKLQPRSSQRLRALTAAGLLLFALLVRHTWPEGTQLLRACLVPGEVTATEEAFSDMMDNLREGESLEDALTVFCRQILDEAKVTD